MILSKMVDIEEGATVETFHISYHKTFFVLILFNITGALLGVLGYICLIFLHDLSMYIKMQYHTLLLVLYFLIYYIC